MINAYQLVVRKGPKPGQIFPLFPITITIGRDPISDIAINDPEVSRQHARLTQTSDSYQIKDLGSTNGTFVNGVQIGAEPVQLAHGNEIQLGSGVSLQFELTPEEDKVEMALETAVPEQLPEESEAPETPEPDPMLPPDFDRLSVIDEVPVTDPHVSTTAVQDELDAAFSQDYIPPPPPDMPRVTIPSSTPVDDENPARRLFFMGMILILLMLCCCCGFLFFMYEWGGDWLLQQMGLLP